MMSMDVQAEEHRGLDRKGGALELAPGAVLYQQGDAAVYLFLIEEGELELVRRTPGGDVTLALLGCGDLLGTEPLIELGSRAATARARGACRVLALEPAILEAVLRIRPVLGVALLGRLARQLRASEERLARPRPSTLEARLVHAASGLEFQLKDQFSNTIGRFDATSGTGPSIDLAPLDEPRSISRLHARLLWWGGQLLLAAEERVVNGTYVNGEHLENGAVRLLEHGDELRFGLVSLKLEKG